MTDARFEDGDDAPLTILARDPDDLTVLSSLVQDAVLTGADMTYDRRQRRFACLINRFRWEDRAAAERAGRPFERARSVLQVQDVLAVRSQGIARGNADQVLSLLAVEWLAGADGTGTLTLVLAGDGAVALDCETMEITLQDVTRPYIAPSRRAPDHGA